MLAAGEVIGGSVFAVGNPSLSRVDWWRWLGQWSIGAGSTAAIAVRWYYAVMHRPFLAMARLGKGGHSLTVLRQNYQG